MEIRQKLAATVALTASIALAAACTKSEPATPVASDASTSTATASAEPTPIVPSPSTVPEPTPGSPTATFTPSDTPAPMLPMLGATPIQPPSDEHTQSPSKAAVRRIAPEEAAMLVQTGDAILLDVRPKESFDKGHIKGAVNIPYTEVANRARKELTPTRWIIPYCT